MSASTTVVAHALEWQVEMGPTHTLKGATVDGASTQMAAFYAALGTTQGALHQPCSSQIPKGHEQGNSLVLDCRGGVVTDTGDRSGFHSTHRLLEEHFAKAGSDSVKASTG